MKKLILIGLMVFLGNTNIMASDDGYSVNLRSVFVSQLMPRMVGVVSMHGYELGISEKTMDIANAIRNKIKPQLKPYIIQLKNLELEMLKLSLRKGTHDEIVTLIEIISRVKVKASLIQLECIEMAKSKYSKKDLKIIKEYLESNKKDMLVYHQVISG